MHTLLDWLIYAAIMVVFILIPDYMSRSRSPFLQKMGKNGFTLLAVVTVGTLVAMMITAQLGFDLTGPSSDREERPGVGPFEF